MHCRGINGPNVDTGDDFPDRLGTGIGADERRPGAGISGGPSFGSPFHHTDHRRRTRSRTISDERQRWEEFVAPFRVLAHTRDVSWEYGCTFRYLQGSGQRIGGNDLWIAAAALAYDMPVVTRNVRHYRRVPRLRIIEYVKP